MRETNITEEGMFSVSSLLPIMRISYSLALLMERQSRANDTGTDGAKF